MEENTPPETISDDDKTYLGAALADYAAATQMLQEAQVRYQSAQSVLNFLQVMFSRKYNLAPADKINEDGQIVRAKTG